jgi:hypothetical protein
MINREERRARIKMQIAKAVSEIDHGDPAAAVLALADGLNAMLHYVESGEAALAARLNELAAREAVSEAKEAQPMARIKVTKR